MLSYDYCHFEICKSSDENLTDKQIDDMRKDVQRLADKAVKQYQIAKDWEQKRLSRTQEMELMERDVKKILSKEEHLRTLGEVAMVKVFQDKNWNEYIQSQYDYEDDFDEQSIL